ncbi:uncharacterized protein B0T23DRAFT_403891 [Neurospora hispaniola]|uniref:Uncharacterized protein n=1 Tax=Neurospora hispaniola TaxID=588809 RepID=A0AAJ0IAS4_9PEZI|nr:hypothetical protein B0T23DRAFT_403891 [Neurospora hispaniola]
MCQREEPDLWTLGNGETRWSAWEQSQRERRRKTNSYQPPALGNRGSRCGSGRVALDGIHPIWSVRTGPCVLTTCQLNMSKQNAESGVKAHVKATGASSAARICHMHCRLSIRVGGFGLGSPSRALVTFHFRTFQQGSEHRNRGEMPSVSSVGHFPSTAGRSRCPVRPQPLHGPSTTRRRQWLSKMICADSILLPFPHSRPPGILVRMQIQLQLQSVAGNLNLTLK